MLHITNLSKSYGHRKIIDNVTFSIPSAGIFVVRGDNGHGKTTLFKCLAGLERFNGNVRWLDTDPDGQIAAAFDDSEVHGRLTGLQNLSILLDISPKEVSAVPVVKQFISDDLLRRRSSSYSLGQRRKLKLAAAFATARPCILLDEPASGLDAAGRRALRRSLESVAAKKCVIISDHEDSSYQDLVSSEFTIRQGKVHRQLNSKQESDE
ncbi:ABC transporter ATP-binding protein [Paenarthrobacter aurescens]|jgi:ABC-type multidrug transport system ATPase subunit|uniref:ABC transporter, ATP-binding protein n=1 Tax=Paenarthrobacter aurescens (strain TC1) TaxID=290340 RepID=A1R400_PAEAT|nr:ATP-binding cassette domain-containing protein [Paenarthrobacter aurescens]ABM10271.1 putative ABC transporter, ATP-binding protein [Paenarthrobacter aurescens TC1]